MPIGFPSFEQCLVPQTGLEIPAACTSLDHLKRESHSCCARHCRSSIKKPRTAQLPIVSYNRAMIDPRTLDDVVSAVARALPRTPQDLERNIRATLTAVFERLDLVTREELEVQQAVLARTRARLEQLEQQIGALESKLAQK